MNRLKLSLAAALFTAAACSSPPPETGPAPMQRPDPREGLRAGQYNAAEATYGVNVMARAQPPEGFKNSTSSDLAFKGNYAIQGNYNGILIWDISNPASPTIVSNTVCPASQNDVSVYQNLLFVSTEGFNGRTDCGTQAFTRADSVSPLRHRGVRIFDISDIRNPKLIKNVQTCRGSHTHTVVEDPRDRNNVYVYVSGSFVVRSPNELAGCEARLEVPNTSLMRIEVIRVPLANPAAAEIVNGARIFAGLAAPPQHGPAIEDTLGYGARLAAAKAQGAYTYTSNGREFILNPAFARMLLDSIARARGAAVATGQDSAYLRANMATVIAPFIGGDQRGPDQCHDITVYPAIGLAGGACEGYGLLLDISDPTNPQRIDAVADSNFSYWHSATFNNDGTKILFSDEWGGGGAPKCRKTDPKEWGANAIFSIVNRKMVFQGYYKLPSIQTVNENCVAHNGSLIPIPGRDVMVQAWYQGGISVFDWTDPKRPFEIAFFDRGPVDSTRQGNGGAWSTYWYNGQIYSSEISRGLDVMDLTPTEHLTQNEIDAAKTVRMEYFNAQGQPKLAWPPSFALARAYADQLERSKCLSGARLGAVRNALSNAERAQPVQRREALLAEASRLDADAAGSCDGAKVRKLAQAARDLAGVTP